jgi:hypothetical protein
MRKLTYFIILFSFFLISQLAVADTVIGFFDSSTQHYWTGYGNGTADDNKDSIGVPDVTGGTATFNDSGNLVSVRIDFTNWTLDKMKPGDLFLSADIDSTWDGNWEYVVSLYNGRTNSPENTDKYQPTGSVDLYAVSGNASPLITGANDDPFGQYWDNYGFRNSHPFAYTGLASDQGAASYYKNGSYIEFTLNPTSPLVFGDYLTIGFTENCANDVLLATIGVPSKTPPVPEPSTLILMGLGLAGIAVYRKFRS